MLRLCTFLLALLALTGCGALNPEKVTVEERLAMWPDAPMPLERQVTLRWNDRQVPYIVAETDRDLAFTLGAVQGHLRSGQIALMRAIAKGELSRHLGPSMADYDHILRILDLGHAAPEIEANFPPETRAWLEAFVAGLNWHQQHAPRPPEAGLMAFAPEPYTVQDIITMGRLAGIDVTWLSYFSLLPLRDRADWPEIWARVLDAGLSTVVSFENPDAADRLQQTLVGRSRSGSNSYVVAPERSASGNALIASDPHLGVELPNMWILVGMKSPGVEAVGFMPPGLPLLGLGRNPELAWGGTSLRAAASDLYDVTGIAPEDIEIRPARIKKRFWFDETRDVRWTPYGPIVSDAKIFPDTSGQDIALRWVGHEPTDEFTAFLKAAKATGPEQFHQAFENYGVAGLNMLFADKRGNIGHVVATALPRRDSFNKHDIVLRPEEDGQAWHALAGALDLPLGLNPAKGFIASANNQPTDTDIPVGFLFNDEDRILRLRSILSNRSDWNVAELSGVQQDVTSPTSAAIARALVAMVDQSIPDFSESRVITALRNWDGRYEEDAHAPVVFENMLSQLIPAVYGEKGASDLDGLPNLMSQLTFMSQYLTRDLQSLPQAERQALLKGVLTATQDQVPHSANWGQMHRMSIGHMLAAIPVIGSSFKVGEFGVGGSRETPMKTSHGLVAGRHGVDYGAQARHISDLGDLDANYFVLLGGQDGWLGSDTFSDQVDLWRDGGYIQMPLRAEKIAHQFPIVRKLTPEPD